VPWPGAARHRTASNVSRSVAGAKIPVGLDATVYCDCYEKGRVRRPPPQPDLVYVDVTGRVELRYDAPGADQRAFCDWLAEACEHGPMGELVSHRLGNFALIGFLRELLARTPERFEVLLTKVLYNGGHAGDQLTPDDVSHVVGEIESLKSTRLTDEGHEELLRHFERQMSDLVAAAQRVCKPITF